MSGRVVYSTGIGRVCPDCRCPDADCTCRGRRHADPSAARQATAAAHAAAAGGAPRDGVVRVGRQTQGRGGKGVTVITGLTLGAAELEKLARELKQRCGSGGTVRDGVVEIQGDHRDLVVAELGKRGWTAKRAGG